MHFSQAVAIIQSQVGIIKGVQVLYSDTVRISADRMYMRNIVLILPFFLSESAGRRYRDQFAAGRYSVDLRSDRAATQGHRSVQHEAGQAQILVSLDCL